MHNNDTQPNYNQKPPLQKANVSGSSKRKPSKDTIEQLSSDLAYEIVNHSYDEVSEPDELTKIIEKFLKNYKSW